MNEIKQQDSRWKRENKREGKALPALGEGHRVIAVALERPLFSKDMDPLCLLSGQAVRKWIPQLRLQSTAVQLNFRQAHVAEYLTQYRNTHKNIH